MKHKPSPPSEPEFYHHVLATLISASIPFLVGGAYAFDRYTGISRKTKDLDVFVRPVDVEPTLALLASVGYKTELTFPHWLGKVFSGENVVDIIFRSGNATSEVDDDWFAHAVTDKLFDLDVKLCPAEEMIWQKALIMERERFDGADVAHLLRARATNLDWSRLLARFGDHWRVLLAHLILFGFIYPAERRQIPESVLADLLDRLRIEMQAPAPQHALCQGTLLSRAQYLIDLECWGLEDARLAPRGQMTPEEIAHWTAAIEEEA